jgi:hypothetical protein
MNRQREEIRKMTESKNHGKVIQRYIELSKKINSPYFLERLSHTLTLIVQPILHFIFWTCFCFFPEVYTYLGGNLNVSFLQFSFYIFSSLRVLWECIHGWLEVIEYHGLAMTIMIWKLLTIRLNVPIISVSSKDKNHQLFKWAAGASLLFDNI